MLHNIVCLLGNDIWKLPWHIVFYDCSLLSSQDLLAIRWFEKHLMVCCLSNLEGWSYWFVWFIMILILYSLVLPLLEVLISYLDFNWENSWWELYFLNNNINISVTVGYLSCKKRTTITIKRKLKSHLFYFGFSAPYCL